MSPERTVSTMLTVVARVDYGFNEKQTNHSICGLSMVMQTVSFHHHLEKMSSADNGELLQGRDGRTHPFLSPSGK